MIWLIAKKCRTYCKTPACTKNNTRYFSFLADIQDYKQRPWPLHPTTTYLIWLPLNKQIFSPIVSWALCHYLFFCYKLKSRIIKSFVVIIHLQCPPNMSKNRNDELGTRSYEHLRRVMRKSAFLRMQKCAQIRWPAPLFSLQKIHVVQFLFFLNPKYHTFSC